MKLFEVLYAFERDGADMWSNRIYVLAQNIGDAWTAARKQFVEDRHIVSLRELPAGEVVKA